MDQVNFERPYNMKVDLYPGYQINRLPPTEVAGLCIRSFILTVLTLGVYNFWGRNEAIKKGYEAIHIDGEPLRYSGTGAGLLGRFLLSTLILLIPVLLFGFGLFGAFGAPDKKYTFLIITVVLFFSPFFVAVWGISYYQNRKYELSQLSWRNQKVSVTGSSLWYGLNVLWTSYLTMLTLGFFLPWQLNILNKILVENTQFGTVSFQYSGKGKELIGSFFIWLLWLIVFAVLLSISLAVFPPLAGGTVVALCVLISSYYLRTRQHMIGASRFGDKAFVLGNINEEHNKTIFKNVFFFLITLGIALPANRIRNKRFYALNLKIIKNDGPSLHPAMKEGFKA